jgi:hypothetical protein
VSDEPRYRLTLAAQRSNVPAIQRIQALLKSLGRAYGFRCILAEELPSELPVKPPVCPEDATKTGSQPEGQRGERSPA